MRFKEFISELFEPKNAVPLMWDKGHLWTYARGNVLINGQEEELEIRFNDTGNGVIVIEFSVGDNFELTGRGGFGPVFATVIQGVKQFIAEHPKVAAFAFTAEERSRAKAYDTISKRVAHQLGWHVVPHNDMVHDPKYQTIVSYGDFTFAIEKGQAPEHRQAAQQPQHGEFMPIFYVRSLEEPDLPMYKVKAKKSADAEYWVRKHQPEYKNTDAFGVFAYKNPLPGKQVIDLGAVKYPPKPQPRVMTPLEKALHDKLNGQYESIGDHDTDDSSITLDPSRGDYEIRNYHKLDKYLAELCNLVERGQASDKDFGMVAAGLLPLKGNYMARLNRPGKNGKRVHAELAVLKDFIAKYGSIPEGTVLITTLSPCTKHLDERDGPSCSSLVERYGIQKVYCGYLDPTQVDDHRDYNLMETSDESIRKKCKAFADTFLDHVHENFADGRHPEDKGDSKRYNVPTKASVSSLRKIAHQGGRRGQLAHWMANMKAGKKK